MSESLAEALPNEQSRVREVLSCYQEIGPSGALACAMIEQSLKNADQAVMSGDVVAMMVAYNDLKEIDV
jgi:2-polyprenyl-3-methyl-5-hydroxy-6-metoxy-1,4-benzoquinol methylase